MNTWEAVSTILAATKPLEHPRGNRLPLYVWGLIGSPTQNDAETEQLLKELDARGMALLASWDPGADREAALHEALRIGHLQQRLGLSVGVEAIKPLYAFFNGDPATAHVDAEGRGFFDYSFAAETPIGCPFALDHRRAAIREQVEFFAEAYHQAGIDIDFIFSDWEIDGPLEWNDAWEHAKRCARCRQQLPEIEDFGRFQTTLHQIRADLQRECYAQPILSRFPRALVGNYAVYPHDGWRYWYDYFERFNPNLPYRLDQREPCRPWGREFEDTGYTFAMPVMYTWYRTFDWYDFANPDYRWFYNMLKVGSNAGQHTPADTPIISFVHRTTTSPPEEGIAPHVQQMSVEAYQELLWHALLRRHATFFLWCPSEEIGQEIGPLHAVWADSLAYREFLEAGEPVTFAVPANEGPVLSGLRLGRRVLVRRSDFGPVAGDATLVVAGQSLRVPPLPGQCQFLTLDA